ncbi:MAG TPA: EAL domain-containing protein [Thiobacillus sp.]|nr:EAL domain-containing protein [Thiobacillus sp.]
MWIPLVALTVAGALSLTSLYQRLDALSLDTQTRLVAQNYFFKDALVIDIDAPSLQELQTFFGGWPYKRDTYALLIDYLNEMGARAVALDIVFADPREGDERLSEAIVRAGNVVLASNALNESEAGEQARADLSGLAWQVPSGLRAYNWPAVQAPLPELTRPASQHVHVGVVSVVADQDGILRRLPLFHRFNGQYLPSFPLAAQFSGEPQPRVQVDPDGATQVGAHVWPTDKEGALRLAFPRNKNSVLTMPFSHVAKAMLGLPGQELDPDLFRGKTIFVGSTTLLSDRVLTPVGAMNGVHVLAIAHQSLARNLFLAPRDWRWTGALLLVALLPSLLLLQHPHRSALVGATLGLAAAFAIYGGHLALLYGLQQESPLLLPLLVVLIATILEVVRAVRLRNEEQKTEIHVLANDDPLTLLPNRFSLQAQLAHAIEYARPTHDHLAVLLIGLNDFRPINNALGHETGDQLLAEAAARLRAGVQSTDIVARMGADEFVVVSRADAASATRSANTILSAFAKPYFLANQELHISANVGISLYPIDGEDVATLLKHADGAMRDAKAQGRNTSRLFTPDLSRAAMERLLIENQLRQALARNELVLFYQPQIDMQSRRMVAVEALVRWNHPTRGLLGPDHFIPMAEHCELDLPLGEWVLRAACKQMRAWQLAGLTHIKRVAVNLSARQFEQSDLPEFVASVLKESQLDARHLELEITESVAMKNPSHSIEILNALRDMGIDLALDDFGTGYSSLTYFKLFPVTSLKIDKSFVRNIETDRYDAEICMATITMARKLGLRVVAEGIETPGQFHFLYNIECSGAQGYLISHPLFAADLALFEPSHIPN